MKPLMRFKRLNLLLIFLVFTSFPAYAKLCPDAEQAREAWLKTVAEWNRLNEMIDGADINSDAVLQRGIDALGGAADGAPDAVEGVGKACRGTLSRGGILGLSITFTQAMVGLVMDVVPAVNTATGTGVNMKPQWERNRARAEKAMEDALARFLRAKNNCCQKHGADLVVEDSGEDLDRLFIIDQRRAQNWHPPRDVQQLLNPALTGLQAHNRVRPNGLPISTYARNVPKSLRIDPTTTLVDSGDGSWVQLSRIR